MKELNHCNKLRGNCFDCNVIGYQCNITYHDLKWSGSDWLVRKNHYYNKRNVESDIYIILMRGLNR